VVKDIYKISGINGNEIFIRSADLGHSKVHLRNDGILQINFGDNVEMDLKESVEIIETMGDFTGGKKALVLNIAGKNTSATSAAREYSASAAGLRFTIADAFVVKNLAQKILANFYISFNKPLVKTRIFDDEEKALEWLKSLL
jgi:hypothetical protein